MKLHDEKLTLTVTEAAKLTGIGLNKMYELVNSKGFPAIRTGRKILIVRRKYTEWLEENIGKVF